MEERGMGGGVGGMKEWRGWGVGEWVMGGIGMSKVRMRGWEMGDGRDRENGGWRRWREWVVR